MTYFQWIFNDIWKKREIFHGIFITFEIGIFVTLNYRDNGPCPAWFPADWWIIVLPFSDNLTLTCVIGSGNTDNATTLPNHFHPNHILCTDTDCSRLINGRCPCYRMCQMTWCLSSFMQVWSGSAYYMGGVGPRGPFVLHEAPSSCWHTWISTLRLSWHLPMTLTQLTLMTFLRCAISVPGKLMHKLYSQYPSITRPFSIDI